MDDLVLTGNDNNYIASLLTRLNLVFDMKYLGPLRHFLGVEVNRTSTGLFLSQTKYTKDILLRTSMLEAKPVGSPYSYKPSVPDQSNSMDDPKFYRSIAGALQYLTLTRPDLAFTVNQLCQRMHHPTTTDFAALKCVLRYLKRTLTYGININGGGLHLTAYSDADWARDPID